MTEIALALLLAAAGCGPPTADACRKQADKEWTDEADTWDYRCDDIVKAEQEREQAAELAQQRAECQRLGLIAVADAPTSCPQVDDCHNDWPGVCPSGWECDREVRGIEVCVPDTAAAPDYCVRCVDAAAVQAVRDAEQAARLAEKDREERARQDKELRQQRERAVSDREASSGQCDPERLAVLDAEFKRAVAEQASLGFKLVWDRRIATRDGLGFDVNLPATYELCVLAVSIDTVGLVQGERGYSDGWKDPPSPTKAALDLAPTTGPRQQVDLSAHGCVVYGVLSRPRP